MCIKLCIATNLAKRHLILYELARVHCASAGPIASYNNYLFSSPLYIQSNSIHQPPILKSEFPTSVTNLESSPTFPQKAGRVTIDVVTEEALDNTNEEENTEKRCYMHGDM